MVEQSLEVTPSLVHAPLVTEHLGLSVHHSIAGDERDSGAARRSTHVRLDRGGAGRPTGHVEAREAVTGRRAGWPQAWPLGCLAARLPDRQAANLHGSMTVRESLG